MLLHAGIMAVILLGSAADFLYKGQIIFAGQILGYKGLPENFHAPRLTSPTGRVNSGHNNSIFMCTNFTLISDLAGFYGFLYVICMPLLLINVARSDTKSY